MTVDAPSKTETCYIAGPMRGRPEFNFPAFDQARDAIRKRFPNASVISPADLARETYPNHTDWSELPDGWSMKAAVERDVAAILRCDGLILLPGWEVSRGAKAERALAEWLGLWVALYIRDSHSFVLIPQ